MRSEEEIEGAFSQFNEHKSLRLKSDSFKWGYFIGKLTALGWVLGDTSGDMSNEYDFEDYIQELRSTRGNIHPLDENEKE